MFIRGKPFYFGYKIWYSCGSDGYPYHMQIYQRKQSNAIDQPLGTRVINNMVSIISSNSNVLHHQLYFDNFFYDYHLMIEFAEKSIQATGTYEKTEHKVRANNLLKTKSCRSKKEKYTITAVIKKYTLLFGMTTLS